MVFESDDGASVETTSPWEVKFPVVLLTIGLFMLMVEWFVFSSVTGGLVGFREVVMNRILYLPVTFLAMFITSEILSTDFGAVRSAALKATGFYLFTGVFLDVGIMLGYPAPGVAIGFAVLVFLYFKGFRLSIFESIVTIIAVGLVRRVPRMDCRQVLPRIRARKTSKRSTRASSR